MQDRVVTRPHCFERGLHFRVGLCAGALVYSLGVGVSVTNGGACAQIIK